MYIIILAHPQRPDDAHDGVDGVPPRLGPLLLVLRDLGARDDPLEDVPDLDLGYSEDEINCFD